MTITHTIIQSVVPDEIRGRVAAVYSMHVGGGMAFANLLYGRLADFWSAGSIMAVVGAAFTVVVVVTIVASGFWRGVYFRGEARPVVAVAAAGGRRLTMGGCRRQPDFSTPDRSTLSPQGPSHGLGNEVVETGPGGSKQSS